MSVFKTDKLNPCVCGFKPGHYNVYYGRTPYDVVCPNCKKQTSMAKCLVTGWYGNVVDYWNQHVSKLTKEEIDKEVREFNEEKIREDPYGECREYAYYWYSGNGEKLYVTSK